MYKRQSFRSKRLKGCIENLFSHFIKKLGELKEIEFDNIFIDGTKIEASANRYTFVWKKSIAKNEANLQDKIKEIFLKINQNLHLCFIIDNSIISVDDATSLKNILYSIEMCIRDRESYALKLAFIVSL